MNIVPYTLLVILTQHLMARGGAVGSENALQAGRQRGSVPDGVIGNIDIILLASLWSWGRLSL